MIGGFIVGLTLLAQSAASQQPPEKPKPLTAVIRGRVTDATTGRPLRHAHVELRGSAPEAGRPDMYFLVPTDANGRFEFIQLAAGPYTIKASKARFVTRAWGQTRPSDTEGTLDLKDGDTRDDIELALWRGGTVTGRVIDEAGGPMANISIGFSRPAFVDGVRRLQGILAGAETDDRGEFRAYGVPPGKYFLVALERTIDDSEVPVWYPGTINEAEAVAVTVAAEKETTGLVLPMVSVRKHRVTGTAFDVNGRPMSSFNLIAHEQGGRQVTQSTTRPDGTFRIDLPPGRYQVRAAPVAAKGSAAGAADPAVAMITVGSEDITGLTLTATAGRRIVGSVRFEGPVPPDVRLTPIGIRAHPRREGAWSTYYVIPTGNVAADGTFEITGVRSPSLIRPQVPLPNGWSLKSVTVRDVDVTDTYLDVPSDLTDIVVTLTTQSSTLVGSVVDDGQKPVSDFVVVVFPDDPSRWAFGSRYVATAASDGGRFSAALPPGQDYLAAAVPFLEKGQEQDPGFLESLRRSAERFSLQEGETRRLVLRLIRPD